MGWLLCACGDEGIVARKVGQGKRGGGPWVFGRANENRLANSVHWMYNAVRVANMRARCERPVGSYGAVDAIAHNLT